jgi:predicted small lipoprotein YifL
MQRNHRSAIACALAFLLSLLAVAGCGQKGDLYLPDKPQASGGAGGTMEEFEVEEEDAVTVQGPR